ncbi:MAG: hypothetical protein ACO24V_05390 [Candidatus Nanopelagicales bacterium]
MSSNDGAKSQPRRSATGNRKYTVRSSNSSNSRSSINKSKSTGSRTTSNRSSAARNDRKDQSSKSSPRVEGRSAQRPFDRNRDTADRNETPSRDRGSSVRGTSGAKKFAGERNRAAVKRTDSPRKFNPDRERGDGSNRVGSRSTQNRSGASRTGTTNRGGRDRSDRPQKFDTPRRFRGDLPRRERDQRARGTAPVIDQDVTGDELGDELTNELRTLPGGLTITVAQHLVMTQRYLEIDPELALVHAKHAKELAGRFPIVREIVGIAHYVNGNWQEALNDFRAVKRMAPADHLIAMMADCERGLGRPERAIAMLAEQRKLTGVDRIEAAIVESGARMDLNQFDAALVALKIPALTGFPSDQTAYARLCFAYGAVLVKLGRADEALSWFKKANNADPAATLAAEHLPEVSGEIYLDDLDAE